MDHRLFSFGEDDLLHRVRGHAGDQVNLGQIVCTVVWVDASERFTPAEREQVISRLAEELQAEVDKFKYDTAADVEYVNAIRERAGRELVWLDVHKDPDVFSRETVLSPSDDPVSRLWNHVTGQFRAWERTPQPPKHFQRMLPAEFSKEQYAEARHRVRAYNRSIARATQTDDEKALVSAIQELEGWSVGVTQYRRVWAQAVWHAAHETERPGATASAAFHAFRPEILTQLQAPQPRPTGSHEGARPSGGEVAGLQTEGVDLNRGEIKVLGKGRSCERSTSLTTHLSPWSPGWKCVRPWP